MLIRLFTSKCAFYVGDSTAKVVNSEQITTPADSIQTEDSW